MSTLIRKSELQQRGICLNQILDETITRNFPILHAKLQHHGFNRNEKTTGRRIDQLFA